MSPSLNMALIQNPQDIVAPLTLYSLWGSCGEIASRPTHCFESRTLSLIHSHCFSLQKFRQDLCNSNWRGVSGTLVLTSTSYPGNALLGRTQNKLLEVWAKKNGLAWMVQSPPENTKTCLRSLGVHVKRPYSQIPYVNGRN